MKVIDLNESYLDDYLVCLEDWSDDMREAGDHKKRWYEFMKDKGLRVKIAINEEGVAGGMIQYLPVEHSIIKGQDLYFIYCIWVHGYKKGRGSFRKQGMGKALLSEAEKDARQSGAKGIAAWGLGIPVWMRASFFKKHGFRKADKNGIQLLMWKPFDQHAKPPSWIRPKQKPASEREGKLLVTSYINGWCPAMNITHERCKKAAQCFENQVTFSQISTIEKNIVESTGYSDADFIGNKMTGIGPPQKFHKLQRKIAKKVKKIRS